MRQAAACIIGNEVLSGKILDTNTHTLAKFLFDNGVDLIRTETIPDELENISNTVQRLSALVGKQGFAFTSGGIGPTHDDITYEGVAKAFQRKLTLHQPTYDRMVAYFESKGQPHQMNAARQRMAMLPEGCEVLSINTWVPFAVVENVYILPGVPVIFKKMLETHAYRFQGQKRHRVLVRTKMLEGDIAATLTETQSNYPNIAIGSYIRLNKGGLEPNEDDSYNVQVSVEGLDEQQVEQVSSNLIQSLQGFRYSPIE